VVSKTKKITEQVIVINDGSHDDTAEVARAAGALVMNHAANRGYGEAIKSCFEAAKANNADVLVILDGDGQHNPDEIPRLLGPILNKEADLVIGSRLLQTKESLAKSPQSGEETLNQEPLTPNPEPVTLDSQLTTMPRYRRFGIGVITFLYNFGLRTKVSDAQSGFRAYNKKTFGSLTLHQKGMSVSIEILDKARRQGAIIKEVPISCRYTTSNLDLKAIRHGMGVALATVAIRLRHLVADRF
jgi:glycosyltransferase involved in cell wall biosynthesis